MAVIASMSFSSATQKQSPIEDRTELTMVLWSSVTRRLANKPVAPCCTNAGVFGMVRTREKSPPSQRQISFALMPAAIEINNWLEFTLSFKPLQTVVITWGLTANTTTSQVLASSLLSV